MAALIFYDFILTTDEEVRLFWGKKLTGATVLFWLNKWLIIVYYATAVISFFKIPDTVRALSQSLYVYPLETNRVALFLC